MTAVERARREALRLEAAGLFERGYLSDAQIARAAVPGDAGRVTVAGQAAQELVGAHAIFEYLRSSTTADAATGPWGCSPDRIQSPSRLPA
ncbi:hypothetical protein [Spirillospora sp. NPDC048819]|uniref:hypothetical protein n=1 Tax=Spirillospora sp. NPDC048819 TaxID=3155268 RepID=UPI0033E7A5B6